MFNVMFLGRIKISNVKREDGDGVERRTMSVPFSLFVLSLSSIRARNQLFISKKSVIVVRRVFFSQVIID